jgi:hypothetical protein
MTKVQKRVLDLARALGGVTHFDLNARQIPFSAMQSLIDKGKLVRNIDSQVWHINPLNE